MHLMYPRIYFQEQIWENVATSLSKDEFTYSNRNTNKTETLKAPNIGFVNTPVILNVAIGYTFEGK